MVDGLILALDLSLNGAGLAVLDVVDSKVKILEAVLVNNKKIKSSEIGKKLENVGLAIEYLLGKYPIKHVVREKGFTRFAGTTQKLFKVVGVSDLVYFKAGFAGEMPEIPPTTIKKLLTGDSKADKLAVEQEVRRYLVSEQVGYEFESDDTSDAVAVGITFLTHKKVKLRRD